MTRPLPVLLLTRPHEASERFAALLDGGEPRFRKIVSPLIAIEVSGPLPEASQVKGLIFTSSAGVTAWQALGGRMDLPAYTVGEATAQAARSAGMAASSAKGSAEDLVDWLISRAPPAPLLHLHGENVRGSVSECLTEAGLPCSGAVIYRQPARDLSPEARQALAGEAPVVAPVFSPRTGELLARVPVKAPLLVAAMSEAVANALSPLHKRKLKVAERPESAAMRAVVSDLLNRAAAGDY